MHANYELVWFVKYYLFQRTLKKLHLVDSVVVLEVEKLGAEAGFVIHIDMVSHTKKILHFSA